VSATGWYVYGIVEAGRAVDGEDDVELVSDGDLAALAAPVDLTEFADLDERLNDRDWLERKALAHEQVLSRAAVDGPVVPLRFGTVYHRRDDVVQLLSERRREFAADLERVRGCVEVGVKGFVERPVLEEHLARERAGVDAATPGRAYLERRRLQQDVAAEAATIIAEAARSTHARLLRRSLAGAVSRPHSRELSGRADEMFLNAAYLVPAADQELRSEVAALGRAYAPLALSFELTGPWPPFNFVGAERAEAT
jgi:hypothetical protein